MQIAIAPEDPDLQSLEDLGARAAGAHYNPAAFSALRHRQLQAHRRDGSIHDQFSADVWALTWNVAGRTPDARSVAEALGRPAPGAAALPDLVLVGIQEAVDLNAREVLLTDGSALGVWAALLHEALAAWPAPTQPLTGQAGAAAPAQQGGQQRAEGTERCPYALIASVQLVGILLLVWARRDHAPHCAEVRSCAVGTGALGFLGNKGGAAVRLHFYHTSLAVVCAHLNANKASPDARNAEFRLLSDRLAFAVPREAAGAHAASAPAVADAPRAASSVPLRLRHHDVTIWLGDLNYRLGSLPDGCGPAAIAECRVRELIQRNDLRPLLLRCQLRDAIATGRAFGGYSEAPILFAPTYKYDIGSGEYDSSDKRRTPAWTDRVLWTERARTDGGPARVSARAYGRREVTASDHRPVFCELTLCVEAECAQKKAKLIQALDAWEESRKPAVSLRPQELRFGPEPPGPAGAASGAQALCVEVRNGGQTVAHFSFRAKQPHGRPFPPWLVVAPSEGSIPPGQSALLYVRLAGGREDAPARASAGLPPVPVRAARSRSWARATVAPTGPPAEEIGPRARAATDAAVALRAAAVRGDEQCARAQEDVLVLSLENGGASRATTVRDEQCARAREDVLVLSLENGGDYFLPVSAAGVSPPPDEAER